MEVEFVQEGASVEIACIDIYRSQTVRDVEGMMEVWHKSGTDVRSS